MAVDASFVVRGAQSAGGFAALRGHQLVAPPLLWSETSSAIHQLGGRGTISMRHATESFERVLRAPVTPQEPDGLRWEAWRLADALGWMKTYDAEYVALARLLGCPLLTIDHRLRRGAARVVKTVSPMEV